MKRLCLLEKFSLFFINKISQYLGNTLKTFSKMQGCKEFLLTNKFSTYKPHYSHIFGLQFWNIFGKVLEVFWKYISPEYIDSIQRQPDKVKGKAVLKNSLKICWKTFSLRLPFCKGSGIESVLLLKQNFFMGVSLGIFQKLSVLICWQQSPEDIPSLLKKRLRHRCFS